MDRIIFHIDVNSAYLSWSAIDLLQANPDSVDIRTIPAIIGGNRKTRHGIVLAKSLPAKNMYHITAMAVATPTILPVPMVAERAVHKSPKLDTSPSPPSSFLIMNLSALLRCLI